MKLVLSHYRTLSGSVAALVLFIVAWETVIRAFNIPPFFLPATNDLIQAFILLVTKGDLLLHLRVTTTETLLGFVLGGTVGAVIGYPLAKMPIMEKILSPYILGLQIAPKIAVAPLFVLWFGFDLTPKVLIAVLITFFPVLVNAIVGVNQTSRDHIEVMRSLNASKWQVFWKVELPTSMPMLFAGLRVASTLALIGVVVGEMVGANSGLGYLVTVGSGMAQTALVFVAVFLLTLIGIGLYLAVVLVEGRVLRWQQVS